MTEMILWVVKTIFCYVYTICNLCYIFNNIDSLIDLERDVKKHEQRLRELGVTYEKLEN
jgi:hypothetical protein